MTNTSDLWVEKYRPDTLEGYVFKNDLMKRTVEEWIKNPEKKKIPIPHLLLTGVQGTGKTTLAYAICNELNVEKGDILYINASKNTGVDEVRQRIANFCSTWPIGDFKVVILDEIDGFSVHAQKALRAEMESHADSARFITTGNYLSKIIPALHSRFQHFHLDGLDHDGYLTRILEILINENIEFDPDSVQAYVDKTFPDLRKCINLINQFSVGGKLQKLNDEDVTSIDYLETFIEMFMKGDIHNARKFLCKNVKDDQFEDIYKYFYQNVQLFGDNDLDQASAVVIIAESMRDHTIAFDPEINLAACCVRLSELRK